MKKEHFKEQKMSYEVKGKILGFDNLKRVEIIKVDDLFYTIKDIDDENISFTAVNPYQLREYSFDIKPTTQELIGFTKDSNVNVYNIVVIQKPLENSTINFLAPIIVNEDNKTIAQEVLDKTRHSDCGFTQSIASFKEND
jgi:flagellar assembly factor FliW